MEKVQYKMTGLTCEGCTCGHCGQPILIYLRCLDGIVHVHPNFILDSVEIEYDQEIISPKEIVKMVQKRGYSIDEI
ncbi:MAG: hypothetical protein KKH92_07275 [Firmicutes bacterium]|nr:hypothetical protein [Bacillota bacterium]